MRTLGIISSKGGVGKTTVSINLAAAMMATRKSVVLVDSDIRTCGVGLQLGILSVPKTINDALNRRCNILEAMHIHSSGLKVIPASLCLKDANVKNLKSVIRQPSMSGSTVVIDTPPGMDPAVLAVFGFVDEILVVSTPDIPSIADAMKSIKAAKDAGCNVLGMVVNRYSRSIFREISTADIEAACETPVIGAIPEDKNIGKSIFKRTPLVVMKPRSPASKAFRSIASRISDLAPERSRALA